MQEEDFKKQMAGDLKATLDAAIKEGRMTTKVETEALAAYTAERAAHLAASVGQPGFDEAVIAERDNVALKSAMAVGRAASWSDQRLLGIIEAALSFGAKGRAAG